MATGRLPNIDDYAASNAAPRPGTSAPVATPVRGGMGEGLQQAADDVSRASVIIEDTNRRQDTMVAEAAFNRLQEQRMALEFDEKEGFASKRQGAAVGKQFLDAYQGRFTDAAKLIEDGLENDQQRSLFRQRAQIAGLQYRGSLLAHQARETEAFNTATEQGTMEVTLRAMAQHPEDEDAFQAGLARLTATTEEAALRRGLPQSMIDANKGKAFDAAYTARIIATMQGVPGVMEGNAAAAEEMFKSVQDRLGQDAQINLARQVEGGVQKELFNGAFVVVKQAAGDMDAIHAARAMLDTDRFKRLDERQRVTLEATLDGYETRLIQQREAAAARAIREQELRLHTAGAAFQTAEKLIDQGIPLAAEEYERLAMLTNGTPYAAGLLRLQQHARLVGGTAAAPIESQRQALDNALADIAQNGISEERARRRDALQKVYDGSLADIKEDPLRAALRRGVVTDLPEIDTGSVQGLLSTVKQRMGAAATAQAWAGRTAQVSPLTADESRQVADMLQALPPKQRSSAIASLAAQIGPQASAGMAAQMAPAKSDARPEDKALSLAFALAADATTAGRYTSEILLTGQQALKDKAVKVEGGADFGWRAEIAREVDGLFPSQSMANSAKEAAYLIRAGLAFEGGGSAQQAVKLAVGGEVVERNGRKIVLPPQMQAADFDDRIRAVKASDFGKQAPDGMVRIGGQAVPLEQFVAKLPDAQLVVAGRGRYIVMGGSTPVTNSQGRPIVVEVSDGTR